MINMIYFLQISFSLSASLAFWYNHMYEKHTFGYKHPNKTILQEHTKNMKASFKWKDRCTIHDCKSTVFM